MNMNELDIDEALKEINYFLSKEQKKYFQLESLDVKNLVNNLLHEKELEFSPLNLASIIENLGLNAEYKDNVENFVQLDNINKTIYINNDGVNMKFKLYQIAVEIGKFVLNQNFGESNTLKREAEANIFAIELLMPYNKFRNKMIFGYSIDNLSNYFNVSYEVAEHRYNYIAKKLD